MAVSNEQVATWVATGLSPQQLSQATGVPVNEIIAGVAATVAPNSSINMGGTVIQPVYSSTGEGENFQQGGISEILTYRAGQGTGDTYTKYTPTGEVAGAGKFQDVKSLGESLGDDLTTLSPVILAALGGYAASSLLGAGAAAGTTGLTAEQLAVVNALGGAEVAGGLTAAEAAAAGLGGGFTGTAGLLTGAGMTAEQVAAMEGLGGADVVGGLTTADATAAGLGGGFTGTGGLLTGAGTGMTAEQIAAMEGLGGTEVAGGLTAADAATAGLGGGFTGAVTAGAGAGLTSGQITNLVKAGTGLLGATGLVNTVTQPGGTTVSNQMPTQSSPQNNTSYYNQLQQYYNAYLPQTPRDVVSPLYDWYSGSFGQTPPTSTTTNTTAGANTAVNTGMQSTAKPTLLNSPALRDTSYSSATQAVAPAGTPAQKADLYNQMLNAGYTDAAARALVERSIGAQTNTDWAYLQQLAQPQTQAQPQPQPQTFTDPVNRSLVNDPQYRDIAQYVATTGTPAQKAEWYNSMIGSGYSDAAVKALVDSAAGTQSSSDWAYLQQLAASR